MINCTLTPLNDTQGFCPKCDPKRRRPISLGAKRNCLDGKSRGLGDTIAKITRAVGIKPCDGCKGRQKKLNDLFPYKAK